MNLSTSVMRLARKSAAQTAAAIIAAALPLLAAACSDSPSATGSGHSTTASGSAHSKALAYAECVRSHGVPDFPDPGSSGGFDKATVSQLAAGNSQFQTATHTCAHLLPSGIGSTDAAAVVRQEWNGMLRFARCMRSHGEPNWPDPSPYPPRPSDPTFNLPASIQPVPQTISKMHECLRLVPNNAVLGHIDNNNWTATEQQMAGQG
ncbi:MAG TPA: hypothetical protein VGH53_24100 [Streptosporangiaceae bacterium]